MMPHFRGWLSISISNIHSSAVMQKPERIEVLIWTKNSVGSEGTAAGKRQGQGACGGMWLQKFGEYRKTWEILQGLRKTQWSKSWGGIDWKGIFTMI